MPATLIRNAHVYAPEDLGVNDVLIANGKFLARWRGSTRISD